MHDVHILLGVGACMQLAHIAAEAMGDLDAQADALHSIGTVYEAMGSLDRAKKPLRKAYKIVRAPAGKCDGRVRGRNREGTGEGEGGGVCGGEAFKVLH